MKKPEGGPAFGSIAVSTQGDEYGNQGMSMRDYFAAATLAGLCRLDGPPKTADDVAERAYRIADAMIALRERNK